MRDQSAAHASERLHRFFHRVSALSPEQVRALCSVQRSSTTSHLAFEVHPDRLAAVPSGSWTRDHDLLVRHAHERAGVCAGRLAPFGRRRLLAVVLGDAALVVISDSCPRPVLTPALRERLAAPWRTTLGACPADEHRTGTSSPQAGQRSVRAFALQDGEQGPPHDHQIQR